MRFIIHGAGALGSLVGGRLAAAGAEVILIGRDPHIAVIAERGLELRRADGREVVTSISARTSLAGLTPAPDDILFLAVKSSATPAAVQELREHFGEATPIFCLQNGVRNEELTARRFLHVYGVMAGLVARRIAPGVVAQVLYNDLVLGGYPHGCNETGLVVADWLGRAGFQVAIHESIMAVKWSKLVLNLNNATLAILNCHLQLAMVRPDVAALMAEVVEEGIRVLDVAGIPIVDPGSPYDLAAYAAQLRGVRADEASIAAARSLPPDERAYPSTWTDLHEERGETEASFLNGEIVRLGEKVGLPVPFNSTLLEIVERMAADRTAPGAIDSGQLVALVADRG